jgi:hypothetical protein
MYTIEKRIVNDAIWWNPFTWNKSHIEQRRVWDMDGKITSRHEMIMFLNDGHKSKWEVVNETSNP